jgi:hypothetical protein
MKTKCSVFLAVCLMFVSGVVFAGDSVGERTKAAERYLTVMPMKKMMSDSIVEMAKQVPEGKREAFKKEMNKLINVDELQKITKQAMIKIFTAEELNALADFYGSKPGQSAMKKFGRYMAEIMPHIQKELMRAGQQAAKSI